jgi:hypothetical protein
MYKTSQRWKSNRERRLKKLLALHPNNKQISQAIKDLSYRRKTPGTVGSWSKTSIHIAKLFKLFVGRVDKDIFSSNPKVQAPALMLHSNQQRTAPAGKVDFTLAARAHDKRGLPVWG